MQQGEGIYTLSNYRNPETPNRQYGWPWMPISGDGKLQLTHFCNRSIIMQTAVKTRNTHLGKSRDPHALCKSLGGLPGVLGKYNKSTGNR